MIVFESTQKATTIRQESYSKEKAGLLGMSLFLWLDALFNRGFRHDSLAVDLRPVDSKMLHDSFDRMSQMLRGQFSGLHQSHQCNGVANSSSGCIWGLQSRRQGRNGLK
ncbi:hypothetical protein BO78DRAFT_421837 [Aspergillus sclerotiicarbonarius CBS 121057]|uniref:Uncharacterized protein n=1 Tax=Aspergillus sclerotiicarbonarius (strain CBS 121057 / IBT 28362) TaxID=1448318 RepID=A0A319EQL0_ASPSB|nr:hypothetical protein BO78DRAFT_421837 [Aspergillus sclerotiicarbonarius CBS 121057]